MANRRSQREDVRVTKAPKFFKIVVNPQLHRLKFPDEFTRRYGKILPECVGLKVPDGLKWQIKLLHSNGEIWLNEGLEFFDKYYLIDLGHLLLFEYDFKSNFNVHIYDTSASEIIYPGDYSDEAYKNETSDVKFSFDDSDENLDEADETKDDLFIDLEKKRKMGKTDENHRLTRKTVQKSVRKETSKAYRKAKAFQAKSLSQNLSFTSLMQPSYLSCSAYLFVPATIVRDNSLSNKEIKLCVPNGKIWSVECISHVRSASIRYGWSSFVDDNNLKVGDACVFQLNKNNKTEWNVTIFRN